MAEIATTEIVAYNEFRAQLAELKEYNEKAVFDYASSKGNKDARSHVHKLRRTKSAVDACRKTEKAQSLAYGRKVDAEAKEIIHEIEEMISVHMEPILEIENREKQRVADILDGIEAIRAHAENTDGLSSDQLRKRLKIVSVPEPNEDYWQEFTEQAIGAKAITTATLERLIALEQKREDDQAELDRLRKESEARAQKDRDERIARESAERAKKEAEQKAERDRTAAEARERALTEAKARAEREKEEAEQRAINAEKEAEQRLAREAEEKKKAEAAAQEKREANKKHLAKINNAAAKSLVTNALLTEEQAKRVITIIATGQVPNVSIKY